MKKLRCHFVQHRFDPNSSKAGLLSKHVNSCQECRSFLEETDSIEQQLHSDPPPHDATICRDIMRQIRNVAPTAAPKPSKFQPRVLGAGLATAIAAAIIAMIFINPNDNGNKGPIAEASPPVPKEEPSLAPAENPMQSLAVLMKQQELLRRDARKLGAHLRERVILFQPVN
ncbi:MAG: hypothetical protein ACJA1W_003261 [Akkermansiaceae bacterium]|jgi:hypothetical protein